MYQNLKTKINFIDMMKSIPNYSELKSELYKEDLYKQMKTLCFDIESVFVRKINLKDFEELNNLKTCEDFGSNYVIINKFEALSDSENNVD
jgi:hypothetical protein